MQVQDVLCVYIFKICFLLGERKLVDNESTTLFVVLKLYVTTFKAHCCVSGLVCSNAAGLG